MRKITDDIHRYSNVVVIVFGILGNILVIISILTQKKVLKNNYYFVVLHLAICDLGALIVYLIMHVNWHLSENSSLLIPPCTVLSVAQSFFLKTQE